MEIKATLNKPYTDKQKIDFIVEQNHKLGYEIRQVETTYEVEIKVPSVIKEIITETIQVPVLDENDNPILDEDGNPTFEEKTVEREIERTETEIITETIEVPVLDEEGNQTFESQTVEKEVVKYKTEIVEKTDYNLEAWGYTEEEKLNIAKTNKYNEINNGARKYLESGEALFEVTEGKHIEATDGNIAKLSAYALSFITGVQSEVYWNTKEDETIVLTQEQLSTVLQGIGQVQAEVWNIKFPAYLARLEAAQTVEDVDAIVIDYSLPVMVEDVPHNDGEFQNEPC